MSTMSEVAFLLGGSQVKVLTTQGRGFTPEEMAERATDKIISVGSQTHPAIRDQAEAFRNQINKVLVFFVKSFNNEVHSFILIPSIAPISIL